jgi:hypothetical protein
LSFLLFSIASLLGTFRFLGFSSFASSHSYFTSLSSRISFLFIGLAFYFLGSIYSAASQSNKHKQFSPLSVHEINSSSSPPSSLFGCIFFGIILFSELFRLLGFHSFLSLFSTLSSLIGLLLLAFRSFTFLLLQPSDEESLTILGLTPVSLQFSSFLLLFSVVLIPLGRSLAKSKLNIHPTTAFHLTLSLSCICLHQAALILLFPPIPPPMMEFH